MSNVEETDSYSRDDFIRILVQVIGGFFILFFMFGFYNLIIGGDINFMWVSSIFTKEATIFLGLFFLSPFIFFGLYHFLNGLKEVVLLLVSVLYSLRSGS